jgi:hypothetical protein
MFKLLDYPGTFKSIDRTPVHQLMCKTCNLLYNPISFSHLFIYGSFYKSFQHLGLYSVARQNNQSIINQSKRMWKEWLMAYLRHYPRICPELLKKKKLSSGQLVSGPRSEHRTSKTTKHKAICCAVSLLYYAHN